MSSTIISKTILNEHTGEITTEDFKLVETEKTIKIKGGFEIMYKSYEDVLRNIVKSNKDLKIVLAIKDKFTYKKTEAYLSATELAKELNVSKLKITLLIKSLVEEKLLMRINRGVYRLNPFMYLPYKAAGAELQKEWRELEKEKEK